MKTFYVDLLFIGKIVNLKIYVSIMIDHKNINYNQKKI